MDGAEHVPMGVGRYDHRVNVFVCQKFAKIVIRPHLFTAGHLADPGQVPGMNVADGGHPHAGQFHERWQGLWHRCAAADDTEMDGVVGTRCWPQCPPQRGSLPPSSMPRQRPSCPETPVGWFGSSWMLLLIARSAMELGNSVSQ